MRAQFLAIAAASLVAVPAMAQSAAGAGADYATGSAALPPPAPLPAPNQLPAPASVAAAPVLIQVDPQARADWLSECRRRTAAGREWDDDRPRRRHRDAPVAEPGRDSCAAYLDDWFAWHANYARSWQSYWAAQQSARGISCNCGGEVVEEIEEQVVPVRRTAPRRAAPMRRDKRVRVW